MCVYKFFFKILIILFLFVNPSWSEDFDNVLITGNDRISNQTILVFSELPDNNFLDPILYRINPQATKKPCVMLNSMLIKGI